jgi:hypothetical protein
MTDCLDIEVVIKQSVLHGSTDRVSLQRVATVYLDRDDCRVSASVEATSSLATNRRRTLRTTITIHHVSRRGTPSIFDLSIGHDNLFHEDSHQPGEQLCAL